MLDNDDIKAIHMLMENHINGNLLSTPPLGRGEELVLKVEKSRSKQKPLLGLLILEENI